MFFPTDKSLTSHCFPYIIDCRNSGGVGGGEGRGEGRGGMVPRSGWKLTWAAEEVMDDHYVCEHRSQRYGRRFWRSCQTRMRKSKRCKWIRPDLRFRWGVASSLLLIVLIVICVFSSLWLLISIFFSSPLLLIVLIIVFVFSSPLLVIVLINSFLIHIAFDSVNFLISIAGDSVN